MEAVEPFPLDRVERLRCRLVSFGEDHHALLLVVHHLVADGLSSSLLGRELIALYAAIVEGRPSELATPSLTYAQHAVSEWRRSLRPECDPALHHWMRILQPPWPELLPQPVNIARSFASQTVPVSIPASVASRASAVAAASATTPFVVWLAAFMASLARCSGGRDVRVGTPIAGRDRADLWDVVGLFMRTLVIRASLQPELPGPEILARVKEAYLEAWTHSALSFELIRHVMEHDMGLDVASIFEALFLYNYGVSAPPQNGGGLRVRSLDTGGGFGIRDLTVTTHPVILSLHHWPDDTVVGELIVKPDRVSEEQVRVLIDQLQLALVEMANLSDPNDREKA
jgi:hypothetical protein